MQLLQSESHMRLTYSFVGGCGSLWGSWGWDATAPRYGWVRQWVLLCTHTDWYSWVGAGCQRKEAWLTLLLGHKPYYARTLQTSQEQFHWKHFLFWDLVSFLNTTQGNNGLLLPGNQTKGFKVFHIKNRKTQEGDNNYISKSF